MIQKLKWKFIGVASASALVVLILVLGAVNIISYRNVMSEAYETLEILVQHSGEIPEPDDSENIIKAKDLDITPETKYETRYFSIHLENGKVTKFDNSHIAAVDVGDLAEFKKIAKSNTREKGILSWDGYSYAYMKKDGKNGIRDVFFLDCTKRIETVHNLVKFSAYIGAISMMLLALVLSIFSRKAISPIAKNMQAQKQFITNASHELKTPLAVISANTEVMEMMNGKSEWTESNKRQINRMSGLVSQLVILSKLEERQDIILAEVNFSHEASDVVESFQAVAETEGKKIESKIAPDIKINADEKGAREIVSILVDNAVKYCDDNGTVTVILERKGKNAVLSVTNSYEEGKNVDYSRFFERFYREDQSHNNAKKGFGIGLSMADSLVKMFKGKITAGYKDGKITFTVVI